MSSKIRLSAGSCNDLSPHLESLSLGPRSIIMPEVTVSPGTPQDKRKRLRHQIKNMVGNLEKECCRLIFDVFPEKIKVLDDMYKKRKEFNLKKDQVTQELPTIEEMTGCNKEEQEKKICYRFCLCKSGTSQSC